MMKKRPLVAALMLLSFSGLAAANSNSYVLQFHTNTFASSKPVLVNGNAPDKSSGDYSYAPSGTSSDINALTLAFSTVNSPTPFGSFNNIYTVTTKYYPINSTSGYPGNCTDPTKPCIIPIVLNDPNYAPGSCGSDAKVATYSYNGTYTLYVCLSKPHQ